MIRAAVGVGSNLGDAQANVLRAIDALSGIGDLVARSRLYRTKAWGLMEQPDFCNAVVLVETELDPRGLLSALKRLEQDLGRVPGERWGPRAIDLDILYYGGWTVDTPDLQIPHPRLLERAFALVPLAELDARYRGAANALPASERAGVVPLGGGESVALMSDDSFVERVRTLAQAFLETDLVRLRIEEANEDAVELRKPPSAPPSRLAQATAEPLTALAAPVRLEPIKADLVGIFHFSRPAVSEGDDLDRDRELAFVEALGIRNPVRSLGGGRVVKVRCRDGQPVEYGQVLFEIDRG